MFVSAAKLSATTAPGALAMKNLIGLLPVSEYRSSPHCVGGTAPLRRGNAAGGCGLNWLGPSTWR
jgi:hypothetical protein